MYGLFSRMPFDAALVMNVGILALVDTSPTAFALGENTSPIKKSTCSETISSCARRLAVSGALPPSSRLMMTTLRPATVSPCSLKNAAIAASPVLPASVKFPDSVETRPIFNGGASAPAVGAIRTATVAAATPDMNERFMPLRVGRHADSPRRSTAYEHDRIPSNRVRDRLRSPGINLRPRTGRSRHGDAVRRVHAPLLAPGRRGEQGGRGAAERAHPRRRPHRLSRQERPAGSAASALRASRHDAVLRQVRRRRDPLLLPRLALQRRGPRAGSTVRTRRRVAQSRPDPSAGGRRRKTVRFDL